MISYGRTWRVLGEWSGIRGEFTFFCRSGDLCSRRCGDDGAGGAQREREHDLLWRLENLPAPQVSALVASSRK
ncbi:hypothetical protein ACWIG3_32740, partial [Streptomyces celluloflavus]